MKGMSILSESQYPKGQPPQHQDHQPGIASFGKSTPMGRAGQPEEVAPSYVFLACDDSSYMSGQILHVNGGEIVNG